MDDWFGVIHLPFVFFGDDQNPFRDARLVQPGPIFCHFPSRTDWLQDGSFTDFNEENEDEERGMTRTIHITNVVVLVGLLVGTVVVAGGGCVGPAFTMIVFLMRMMRVKVGQKRCTAQTTRISSFRRYFASSSKNSTRLGPACKDQRLRWRSC